MQNSTSESNRRSWGEEHETVALRYLESKGYRLVKRNFRFGRQGEIDLILKDGEVWVFVEVKSRRNHAFGLPEDSVDHRKRKQVIGVARGFFHVMEIAEFEARFDVVAVDYSTGREGKPEIRHHVDAYR